MCGIFGFAGRPEIAAAINVASVLTALRHRGPDDDGTFVDTTTVGRETTQTCILVQTRLAIQDRSAAGHQPMSTHDGRWHLVFNGEIYNHRELRWALQREGDCFAGTSDTEVVLRALVRWGTTALCRLTGMFALALWDKAESSLLLARDRLGEKPLYIASFEGNRGVAFASEIRTLLASGVVERVVSRKGLLSYLEAGSVAEPWTMIQDVWAFPPATAAQFRSGCVRSERFWSSPFCEAPSRRLSEGAPLVRMQLEETVRNQLVADVPIGLFLSAGMDSGAIAAIA